MQFPSTRSLMAGAGRTLFPSPVGLRGITFTSREGPIEAVDGEISATSVVFADDAGSPPVVIVALDICWAALDMARDWRRRIADAVGTTPEHVMLNFSHTHSSPPLLGMPPELDYQADLVRPYHTQLVAAILDSARRAKTALRPARVAAGQGEVRLGINRRELGPDGKIFLGEDPTKPIDPAVSVVRVDDLQGNPIATLFSYGCHPVVVGPNAPVASADFPGPARAIVEQVFGGLALFLQGGGGDIMPVGGMGYERDCRDANHRVGALLAGEVIKVAAVLRSHVVRGERTSMRSLLGSGMTLTPWVPVVGNACTALDARAETVPLKLLPLPSLEVAERLRAERQRDLREAEASGQERNIGTSTRMAMWADSLVDGVQNGAPPETDVEVQVIRINDVVFTGISAEVFSATTRAIRAASPFPATVALGYTNGSRCYLPLAGDYPPGGWDIADRYRVPDMVFQAYMLPTGLDSSSEQRVVNAVLHLVAQVAEPDAVPDGVVGAR